MGAHHGEAADSVSGVHTGYTQSRHSVDTCVDVGAGACAGVRARAVTRGCVLHVNVHVDDVGFNVGRGKHVGPAPYGWVLQYTNTLL